ncbi:PIN domain-containing protein [Neisseria musculi]|uniref:PIN domain-containing protein n=1 Tax=Neisseria musculi TaxID=1815583 RepID=UPI001FD850F9|nr:PIN domain-containing protein [Neisseria musculi]
MCCFGKNVHFIRVAKTGKNALDLYLAYYLGKITGQDKDALIGILLRDGGFDVLVEHLRAGNFCRGL